MRRAHLHCEPTTLEIMDHVLDKGVIVERERGASPPRSSDGIGLFWVDTHVEIVTDFDDRLKNAAGA